MNENKILFHEARTAFEEDRSNNDLIITREQHIPDDFLSDLRNERDGNASTRSGEWLHVAAIPEALYLELLQNHNFDVLKEPIPETLKMLRKLGLDGFIATNKSI